MVDTGMPYGWLKLRKELITALDERPLDYIFSTHPEAPHIGNITLLLGMYPDMRIAGDLRNYHLYYPHAQDRFLTMQCTIPDQYSIRITGIMEHGLSGDHAA